MFAIGLCAILTLSGFAGPQCAIATRQVYPYSQSAGTFSLPYDQKVISSCTVPGTIALAFDDGPYSYTKELLGILKKYGAKGTFFVNGQNRDSIKHYGPLLQQEIGAGHQIGSHTWDHKLRLDKASHSEILSEMNTLDNALCGLIGRSPTYMRPPYLAINETVLKILKGYHVITTDLDTGDGAGSSVAQSFKRFRNGVEAGHSLLLAHDTLPKTVEELAEKMLQHLRTKKIKAVTVGECLGDGEENWYRSCDNLTPPSQLQNQAVDREEIHQDILRR
ncbi:hypothetical protein CNMCM7691_000775 [Aspergillus felis]|uniref:NodB homology domain-containing protein n=1 Tax=Aspergillus felis TaxID=1287682 RepID=A0A8H6QYK9_9EURO|nr:hypothetical protein CNMCM7691_000775 [Aspergillus felis]